MVYVASGANGSVYKVFFVHLNVLHCLAIILFPLQAKWLGIEIALKMIKLPIDAARDNGAELGMYQTHIREKKEALLKEAKICSRYAMNPSLKESCKSIFMILCLVQIAASKYHFIFANWFTEREFVYIN